MIHGIIGLKPPIQNARAPRAAGSAPVSCTRSWMPLRIVRCADLATLRDDRNVEVAGVILVRQRPGSAKGVLFVTIEDETGIANGILWPDRFEAYRRQVMSSSMIAMRGRLQKEGEVVHIICDRITATTRCCSRSAAPTSRSRRERGLDQNPKSLLRSGVMIFIEPNPSSHSA